MTEAEWLACDNPVKLLKFLRDTGRLGERRSRLAGAALCRRIWSLLTDGRSREAVELAERWADGQATAEQLDVAFEAGFDAYEVYLGRDQDELQGWAASAASDLAHPDELVEAVANATREAEGEDGDAPQAEIVRCVFGNPFRRITVDAGWRMPLVVALAHAAYDERHLPSGHLDPARLAVLSDALEDAGCDNADILSHLRSPGPHVRGCWVVDLLLGKE
jgi:hypothetical protein